MIAASAPLIEWTVIALVGLVVSIVNVGFSHARLVALVELGRNGARRPYARTVFFEELLRSGGQLLFVGAAAASLWSTGNPRLDRWLVQLSVVGGAFLIVCQSLLALQLNLRLPRIAERRAAA